MKELEDFIIKLKEEKSNIYHELSFMVEHKFAKEADYLRIKIRIIDTILNELESVAGGRIKGICAKFNWLES